MIAQIDDPRLLDRPELIPFACKLGGGAMLLRVVYAEGEFWFAEEDVLDILNISEIKGRVVEFLSPREWACADVSLAGIGEERLRLMAKSAVLMLVVAQPRRTRARREFIAWLAREATPSTLDADRKQRAQGLLHALEADPLCVLGMGASQWLH